MGIAEGKVIAVGHNHIAFGVGELYAVLWLPAATYIVGLQGIVHILVGIARQSRCFGEIGGILHIVIEPWGEDLVELGPSYILSAPNHTRHDGDAALDYVKSGSFSSLSVPSNMVLSAIKSRVVVVALVGHCELAVTV